MGGKIDLAAHQGDAVVSALGGRNRVPPATEQAVKDHLAVPGNEDRKLMRSSSASDAPAESGNFDGGFAASAEQAARYREAPGEGHDLMQGVPAHDYQLHLVMQDATVAEAAATLFDAMKPSPWPRPTAWRTTITDEGEWQEQELGELPALRALAPRASLEWRCGRLYNVAVYLKDGDPVATVIVNETAQEKAWRWLRAMEEVLERLLTANEVVVRHGIVRRGGPGVACIPRLPVVGTTTYVLAADDDLLNAGFEDAGTMIAVGGWQERTIEGCRLLSRAMHAETNVELLEAIQDGQWAMARVARPGLTDYEFQQPRPEERDIFLDGEDRLEAVGYLEDEQVAVFSCAAGPGEHVQPWEIWMLGRAIRDGKLPGGEVVREIRVGFPDRATAMRERRPLMDIGVVVQCYDGGELITLPRDDQDD